MGKKRVPPAKRKKPRNAGIAMDGGLMGEGGMLTPVRRKKKR